MQSNHSRGELRTLSEDELRQVTGGNSGLAAAFRSFFSGLNTVVHAIEGLIIKASHNDPKVVAGVNAFNKVGLGIENVAIGIASAV
jgi:bacteriocin-like protein